MASPRRLPILIVPAPKRRAVNWAECRRIDELDARRGAVELDPDGAVVNDLEERRVRWRRRCRLSRIITMRHTDMRPTRSKYAVPAKLAHCEARVSAVLLTKKLSLPRRTRADIERLVQITYPVTLPTGLVRSDALAYLLWEASWRGVSTPQQTAQPALHVQTLTAKWWIGLPEETRYGSPADLLNSLASSVASLFRFWQCVLERMRPFGFYFVDPRLVRIEWRPPIRSAQPERQRLEILPYAPRQKSGGRFAGRKVLRTMNRTGARKVPVAAPLVA